MRDGGPEADPASTSVQALVKPQVSDMRDQCKPGIPDTPRERARILYMTTLSLADARANLSKLVESAVTTHERFEVTRNGHRAVVLLSAEDYDALLETVDILSRAEEVQALRDGLKDLDGGRTSSLDEVRSAMLRRGRLRP